MTSPDSARALRLDGVRKSFRRETGETVVALDDITFSIGQGELAALVGPDAAGKTTLIRLLAGLMKASSGIVTVLGVDAAKDPQAIQSRISYMPQQFGLYEDLTVQENLDLYADLHGVATDEEKVAIRRPDGNDWAGSIPGTLSRASFGRDETKARPRLHACTHPRIATPG